MTPPAEPTAVVTGGSRGIGRAVAEALAADGVSLLLTARGGPDLERTASGLGAGHVTADLASPGGVERVVAEARERFGGAPHLLVNAAGVFHLRRVARTPAALLDRHLDVNLRAPFLLSRAFLPGMLERGSGHLVHLGSVAGRRAFPENGAYAASKYGLRGLHEVLRLELRGTGVLTTLVEPGPVDTGAWEGLEARLGEDLPSRADMLSPTAVGEAVAWCVARGREGVSTDVLLLPTP